MEKIIKQSFCKVLYNNKNITKDISDLIISVHYLDFEQGQSDEISLVLKDYKNLFKGDWYPTKGDKLTVEIGYVNLKPLNCGIFTISEFVLNSSDDGDTFTITALATPVTKTLREKNSKGYEAKTLVQIAKEIGKKHGFTVAGAVGNIKIKRISQFLESDIAFLKRISTDYGYIFKITDNVLTFSKIENLENLKITGVLKKENIKRLNLHDTCDKTYSSVSVKYRNSQTGKIMSVSAKGTKTGVKKETLKLNKRCDNKEQAKALAQSALKTAQKTTEGSIDLAKGDTHYIAGINFILDEEYLNFAGKYHITQSRHDISADFYDVSIEVKKC